MKKNLLKVLTVLATVGAISSTIPTTIAHADTTATATARVYSQTLSELQTKINSKIDKINITNSTDEDDFDDKIQDCIKNSSEYKVEIDDFEKEKADRENAGTIKFDIIITDADGVVTKSPVSKTINMLGTNVYRILPELDGKYLSVTDSDIVQKVKDGDDYDESKYYVTNSPIDKDNILTAGWQNIDGGLYYVDADKGVLKGWSEISNNQYHLDEKTGKAKILWENYKGKWYFMDYEGKLVTGFKTIDNVVYYFTPAPQKNSDVIYTQDMSNVLPTMGVMVTGWQKINNSWYYFQGSGAMVTGWQSIDGKWYYMNEQGVMSANTIVDGYKVGADGAWIA